MKRQGPQALGYGRSEPATHRCVWRALSGLLACILFPAIPISGFAALDAAINPRSDFATVPAFAVFAVSVGCVVWWALLRR